MDWMIQAAQLILSLSILIVLHELGHFIPARLFSTRVEKFYLFFDPWFSLFKFKKGETEYGIGWLPLGGYVKISGMIDESMDKEQMKQPAQPWEFRAKPAWQRLIIMVGGVTVNIILAMIIYSGTMFYYGDKYLPNDNVKDGIWAMSEISQNIGLQNGDKIITINGVHPEKFSDIMPELIFGGELTVERNNEQTQLNIPKNIIEQLVENKRKSTILYPRIPFIIVGIPDSSHNAKAGFKAGDKIIAINGQPIEYFDQYNTFADSNKSTTVQLTVLAKDQRRTLTADIDENGKIGVIQGLPSYSELDRLGVYEFKNIEYGFFAAIPAGINKAIEKWVLNVKQFKMMLSPETGAYKGIGGFASIGSLFGATWNWQVFWELTAFLSIILAFMNILPIPALDGGHVMFLLYEIITGRQPHEKVLEYAQIVGFFIVLALVLYANINDILNLLN